MVLRWVMLSTDGLRLVPRLTHPPHEIATGLVQRPIASLHSFGF